jgi:hypothetical protein
MNVDFSVVAVDKEVWTKDMDSFGYGLFHNPFWVEAMSTEASPAIYLNIISDGGRVEAKFSGLIINEGIVKGKTLYGFSGLLFRSSDKAEMSGCMEALRRYAIHIGLSRIMLYCYDHIISEPFMFKGFYAESKDEYYIDFKSGEPVKISSNLKRNAKKAQKAGFVVKESSSPEILRRLFVLLEETRKERFGKYGKDYDPMYIYNMNETSLRTLLDKGYAKMFYSELDGEINTVLYALEDSRRIYFLLMGSDDRAYNTGIPAMIALHISEYAVSKGLDYYNLGIVPKAELGGAGVSLFKEQQGAVRQPGYCYYSWFLRFPYSLLNPMLSRKLRRNPAFVTDSC